MKAVEEDRQSSRSMLKLRWRVTVHRPGTGSFFGPFRRLRDTRLRPKNVPVPLAAFDGIKAIDVTVDGADEVDPNLDLIKGLVVPWFERGSSRRRRVDW